MIKHSGLPKLAVFCIVVLRATGALVDPKASVLAVRVMKKQMDYVYLKSYSFNNDFLIFIEVTRHVSII